jgi:hypothetical protein
MPLAPGTAIGSYEIAALIGAGGMGEVYRARDTRLDRDVAIKVLPDALASDPERMARFEREAKTLAALNHPHIAQIHGLEVAGQMRALAMEFVDGEDLAERLSRGAVLVTLRTAIGGDFAAVALHRLADQQPIRLVRQAFGGRLVEPDLLLFARLGSLYAVQFDTATATITGEARLVADGVANDSLFSTVHADVSRTGLLALVGGGDFAIGRPVWVDRKGGTTALDLPPRVYGALSLTRDGRRLAIHVADAMEHVWVHDLDRDVGRRLPSPDSLGWPGWSWDAHRLSLNDFSLGSGFSTRVHSLDSGLADRPIKIDGLDGWYVNAWGPGDTVAFELFTGVNSRITVGTIEGASLQSAFRGYFASFSPDGKWLAYNSEETGTNEVYIRSLPDGKIVRQVSNGGGIEAQWLPNGELFYRVGQRWFATRVSTEPTLRWDPDPPGLVIETDFVDTPGRSYAVSPDGQRLLTVKPAGPPVDTRHISLVVNWQAALAR